MFSRISLNLYILGCGQEESVFRLSVMRVRFSLIFTLLIFYSLSHALANEPYRCKTNYHDINTDDLSLYDLNNVVPESLFLTVNEENNITFNHFKNVVGFEENKILTFLMFDERFQQIEIIEGSFNKQTYIFNLNIITTDNKMFQLSGLCETGGWGILARELTPDVRDYYNITEEINGVIVTKVFAGSLAELEGIEEEDIISSVNDYSIYSMADMSNAAESYVNTIPEMLIIRNKKDFVRLGVSKELPIPILEIKGNINFDEIFPNTPEPAGLINGYIKNDLDDRLSLIKNNIISSNIPNDKLFELRVLLDTYLQNIDVIDFALVCVEDEGRERDYVQREFLFKPVEGQEINIFDEVDNYTILYRSLWSDSFLNFNYRDVYSNLFGSANYELRSIKYYDDRIHFRSTWNLLSEHSLPSINEAWLYKTDFKYRTLDEWGYYDHYQCEQLNEDWAQYILNFYQLGFLEQAIMELY